MWDTVVALGFAGGRVLEPGCGSGNFFGVAPTDRPLEFVGVEKDPATASVASLLYPQATITAKPFEKLAWPDASFDLVIGNLPFANVTPHDPVHNRDSWSLHNYFIAKSAALVRPGGLVAVVTSRYTLDAASSTFRTWLAQRMELLGAVRLPGTAFGAVAGTNAITDIVILRRHDTNRPQMDGGADRQWTRSVAIEATDDHGDARDRPRVNEWFLARPDERVCGTLGTGRGQYRDNDLIVNAPPDLDAALRAALGSITAGAHTAERSQAATLEAPTTTKARTRPGSEGVIDLRDDAAAVSGPAEPDQRADIDPSTAAPGQQLAVRTDPAAALPAPSDARDNTTRPAGPTEIGPPIDLPDGSILSDSTGGFVRIEGPARVPLKVASTQRVELSMLLQLRDTAMGLLAAEGGGAPDADIEGFRGDLNRVYDQYAARIGALNRSTSTTTKRVDPGTGEPVRSRRFPPMGGFRLDPGWALVSALERYDDETGHATKANIFTERVLKPRQPVTRADTPADALAVSLDRTGRVDLDQIAALLDVDTDAARRHIDPFVFDDPATGALLPADEYLSGNVRAKLGATEQAAAADPTGRYRRHVEALRGVLPTELGPAEIDAALGAPWIAPGDIAAFIHDVLGAPDAIVTHDPLVTAWEVGVSSWRAASVEMTSTWGTARRNAAVLVEAALNQRPVTVHDTLPDGTRVVNETETMAARDKLDQIGERFRAWVWEDPERADRLTTIYNQRFNSIVLRRFDGSHLQLPGLATWFRPHRHQRDAVWRIVNQGDVLLAHVVGAGKTATMVMAAMEMRRLGLVTKPCFVVPNHMLEQFTREFLQLYPQAKVLATNLGGTTAETRRRFVAQCATGDWDGVILPRESFRMIPVSVETEERFLRERLDQLETAINAARSERPRVKELEKALAREQARLERLLNVTNRDSGVCFEQTGLDYLFVDEGHGYKGKRVWSRIPDVTSTESQRATDLDMKLSWLRTRTPNRVATLATGTPIANAISEMWVMQSYIQPAELAAAGCEHFDAWAATFASTVTSLELKPSGGGYQQKTRFARYRNVPELLRLLHANADVRSAADLNLPVPVVHAGGETVAVPASPALLAYVDTLVARAERVKQRSIALTEDNMLKITGDGRKAALDLRLIDPTALASTRTPHPTINAHEPGAPPAGKIDACARRVATIWAEHRDRTYTDATGELSANTGPLQLVFCDLGTPRIDRRWSVYDELRDQLARLGVPTDQIRFVHEAANDRDKAELFQACRDGRVAVLVGSSEKMGVGTNIQNRAIALHHLDCPWRPAELEQRDGRILRQGNQNPEVQILRYVTEGSFDVFMWQTVTRKATFINQVMSSDPASVAREIDDLGDQALTYAQVMAIATGNPLIMERASVESDLAKLRRLRSAHDAEQGLLRRRTEGWNNDLESLDRQLHRLHAAEGRLQPTGGDQFRVVLADRSEITSRSEWGEHLRETIIEFASPYNTQQRKIEAGTLGGLDVTVSIPDQRTQHGAVITIEATGQRIHLTRSDAVEASPVGLARRVEHLIERIPATITDTEHTITHTRQQLDAATNRIGTPFPRQAELDALQRRLAHIEDALAPAPPVVDPMQEAVSVGAQGADPISRVRSRLQSPVNRCEGLSL